jgi:flagellar biosynthetic protein FlhB
MAEAQDQNGTEQATPYKLREAQKRGSVAKSVEVNTLIAVSVLAVVLVFWGKAIAQDQLQLARGILDLAGRLDFGPASVAAWLEKLAAMSLMSFLPLFFLLIVGGVLASLFQTGPVFTAIPLKPDFDRINPFAGLKRLFSLKMLIEAGKSVVKVLLFGAALYWVLSGMVAELAGLNQADSRALLPTLLGDASRVILSLLPIFALVALLDFIYVRWDYQNRMKMTRREMRDELKQREGDPRIRARIRELRVEMLKRSKSLKRVKDADVLITNPQHLAVALRYERGRMAAPEVIAKGAGDLALRMRVVARRSGIPVVENRSLARSLYRNVDLDRPIPETLYAQVARILTWVYAARPAAAGSADGRTA